MCLMSMELKKNVYATSPENMEAAYSFVLFIHHFVI